MTIQPLVEPFDLGTYRAGDPELLVNMAQGAVRRYCGWHVAPTVTQTLTVESDGTTTLLLPSMHVTTLTEVRDITSDDTPPVVLDGWNAKPTARFTAGILERTSCWPRGVLEVDLTHGHDPVPPEVQGVVLDLAEALRNSMGGATRQQVGSVSVQFADTVLSSHQKLVLDGYKLPGQS